MYGSVGGLGVYLRESITQVDIGTQYSVRNGYEETKRGGTGYLSCRPAERQKHVFVIHKYHLYFDRWFSSIIRLLDTISLHGN